MMTKQFADSIYNEEMCLKNIKECINGIQDNTDLRDDMIKELSDSKSRDIMITQYNDLINWHKNNLKFWNNEAKKFI